MTLSRSADRRVTGHQSNIIQRQSSKKSPAAKACSRQGRFYSGMTCTDNDDIIIISNIHFVTYNLNSYFPTQNFEKISLMISS